MGSTLYQASTWDLFLHPGCARRKGRNKTDLRSSVKLLWNPACTPTEPDEISYQAITSGKESVVESGSFRRSRHQTSWGHQAVERLDEIDLKPSPLIADGLPNVVSQPLGSLERSLLITSLGESQPMHLPPNLPGASRQDFHRKLTFSSIRAADTRCRKQSTESHKRAFAGLPIFGSSLQPELFINYRLSPHLGGLQWAQHAHRFKTRKICTQPVLACIEIVYLGVASKAQASNPPEMRC